MQTLQRNQYIPETINGTETKLNNTRTMEQITLIIIIIPTPPFK